MHFPIYTIGADDFCSIDSPNHMFVGGVSVNSFCQRGGLFALSVNRHFGKKMSCTRESNLDMGAHLFVK